MKKAGCFLVLFALGCTIYAQVDTEDELYNRPFDVMAKIKKDSKCGSVTFITDSARSYRYDEVNSTYYIRTSTIYYYDNSGQLSRFNSYLYPGRVPFEQISYQYDQSGTRTGQITERWNGSNYVNYYKSVTDASLYPFVISYTYLWDNISNLWVLNRKVESINNETGNTQTIWIYKLQSDGVSWELILTREYYYDEANTLIKLVDLSGQNEINRMFEYIRDSDGRILTVYTTVYYKDSDSQETQISSKSRQDYSYDRYNNVVSTITYNWNNDSWTPFLQTYIYKHWETDSKRITICHNGITICVLVNAVEIHLNHGDYLGECISGSLKTNNKTKSLYISNDLLGEDISKEIRLFPNPASDVLNISGLTIKRIEIHNVNGQKVLEQSFKDLNDVKIDVNHLQKGTYFILIDIGGAVYVKKVILND